MSSISISMADNPSILVQRVIVEWHGSGTRTPAGILVHLICAKSDLEWWICQCYATRGAWVVRRALGEYPSPPAPLTANSNVLSLSPLNSCELTPPHHSTPLVARGV